MLPFYLIKGLTTFQRAISLIGKRSPTPQMKAIQFSNALAVSHQGDGRGRNREPKACTNHWTQQGTYVFPGQIILPGESDLKIGPLLDPDE